MRLGERVLQLHPLDRRDRFQQPVGKLAPDRRCDLGGFLDRREAIEPLHQRVLQGGRDRERGQRAVEDICAVLFAQQARTQYGLGEFFHEQRPRRRSWRRSCIHHFDGQRLAAGITPATIACASPTPKAVKLKRGDMRAADPRRGKFRAEGDHQQRPQLRQPIDEPAEHVERGRVDPVRILESNTSTGASFLPSPANSAISAATVAAPSAPPGPFPTPGIAPRRRGSTAGQRRAARCPSPPTPNARSSPPTCPIAPLPGSPLTNLAACQIWLVIG